MVELVVTRLSVTESTVTTTSLVVAAAAVAVAVLVGVIILMSWLPPPAVLLASDCAEAGRAAADADGGASKTYFCDAVGVIGLCTARADCNVTSPGFAC